MGAIRIANLGEYARAKEVLGQYVIPTDPTPEGDYDIYLLEVASQIAEFERVNALQNAGITDLATLVELAGSWWVCLDNPSYPRPASNGGFHPRNMTVQEFQTILESLGIKLRISVELVYPPADESTPQLSD